MRQGRNFLPEINFCIGITPHKPRAQSRLTRHCNAKETAFASKSGNRLICKRLQKSHGKIEKSMEDAARLHGYSVLVCNAKETRAREEKALELLRRRNAISK